MESIQELLQQYIRKEKLPLTLLYSQKKPLGHPLSEGPGQHHADALGHLRDPDEAHQRRMEDRAARVRVRMDAHRPGAAGLGLHARVHARPDQCRRLGDRGRRRRY